MNTTRRGRLHAAAASLLLLSASALFVRQAGAQNADQMGGIGQTATMTARATVTAVDMKTRNVTLAFPDGQRMDVVAGPEVQNLAQLHPGDTVIAHYHASVAYVLSPRGAKLPPNSVTTGAATAAPGQMPAGAVGARVVVTGLVVGVDTANHTLQMVDPAGGEVRTVPVVTPEGQRSMTAIKPGDTITAVVSKALLVATEPAK